MEYSSLMHSDLSEQSRHVTVRATGALILGAAVFNCSCLEKVMVPTFRPICSLFLLLVFAACDLVRTSGPETSEGGFSVQATSDHLVLRNATPAPIHYVALEESTSALVDLYFDPSAWPSIPPGAETRIPLSELMGYHRAARQARVYWWTQGRYGEYLVVDLR